MIYKAVDVYNANEELHSIFALRFSLGYSLFMNIEFFTNMLVLLNGCLVTETGS